jgi:nitroimidazol reductase NimA-like FMN-containing flavoprotein (pyridoxamine 5'-phosphate oxidase superfamily)
VKKIENPVHYKSKIVDGLPEFVDGLAEKRKNRKRTSKKQLVMTELDICTGLG